MLQSVLIENYRSIEEMEIAFDPGFTLICGRTDQGKSTLVRALRDLFYHTTGSDHVTHGQRNAKVKALISGEELLWRKGDDYNAYEYGGRRWAKAGRSAPQEIANFLNVEQVDTGHSSFSLNIQEQSNQPWIVAFRGSENANIFTQISSISTLLTVLALIKEDVLALKRDLRYKVKRKEELKTLMVDPLVLDKLTSACDSLEGTISFIHGAISFLEKLENVKGRIDKMKALQEGFKVLEVVQYNGRKAREYLDCIAEVMDALEAKVSLKARWDTIKNDSKANYSLLSELNSQFAQAEGELHSILSEFSVCPVCGQAADSEQIAERLCHE